MMLAPLPPPVDDHADEGARALRQWLQGAWDKAPRISHVEVEGAAIACRHWEAGSRPGLIFVHGYLAHARWWDHIAPHFLDGHRALAPDLSGMGDSGWRGSYTLEQHAREIIAVGRAAGFDQCILVGHSYGGRVALAAAAMAPDYVQRAILVDSMLSIPEHPLPTVPERAKTYRRERAEALERYRLVPPGGWPSPPVRDYVAEHSLTESDRGWGWKFDDRAAAWLNRQGRIATDPAPVPVDFIHGDRSERVQPMLVARLKELLPTCGDPIAIPLCHHHVMIEQPVALVAALRGLLANSRNRAEANSRT
jgi:pimeloyl-ACP methyl ester carboxylesterase